MRIFYIEPHDFAARVPRIKDKVLAMTALGWQVYECVYQLDLRRLGVENGLKYIAVEVKKFKPDIILVEKAPEIDAGWLRSVKGDSRVVAWYGDQRGTVLHHCIGSKMPAIDALGISNSEQIGYYRGLGIPCVFEWQCAANPDTMKPYPDVAPEYDIVFGANNYANSTFPDARGRLEFVNLLARNFKLMLYGAANWGSLPTRPKVVDSDYGRALCSGRMTLGYNNFNDVANYYDWRLFQSLAVGRLHIIKYIKNMERDFENGKHLVWFKTHEEGIKLVRYYLDHPDARETIGAAGRELFLQQIGRAHV
jgi:hypothetical protein